MRSTFPARSHPRHGVIFCHQLVVVGKKHHTYESWQWSGSVEFAISNVVQQKRNILLYRTIKILTTVSKGHYFILPTGFSIDFEDNVFAFLCCTALFFRFCLLQKWGRRIALAFLGLHAGLLGLFWSLRGLKTVTKYIYKFIFRN